MRWQTPWTVDDAARARALWDAGLGYAQIGRELGRSSNSVAGLCTRQDWPRRIAGGAAGPRVKRKSRLPVPVPALEPPPAHEPEPPQEPAPPPVVVVPPPPPPPPREPVAPRGCLYPRGNRPYWDWCNAPVVDGGPYCEPCRRRCWIVPPRRAAA